MGIAYTQFDNRTDTIVAGIKQRILASSDWAHLQLTTGTAATTLASGASGGATSISTNATIPSGSYIVIGNGAANPEVRMTTAVSGAGPYTVSWVSAEPLVNSYSSGANIGVGSYVKCTTTRGAQMVVDLAGTASDTLQLRPTVYQSHDGTTAGNSLATYVVFKRLTGAATNILHCRVSALKEALYFDIEGPRASETGADNSSVGSYKSPFYLGDINPYDVADTTPAVVLAAGVTTAGDQHVYVKVSKNRDGTQTWVSGILRALAYPSYGVALSNSTIPPVAKNGDFVQSPYVVFETADGMRGRVNYLHFGGFNAVVVDQFEATPPTPGAEMIFGSWKYRALVPFRTDTNVFHAYAFGGANNNSGYTVSPILWVPVAAYP